MNEITFTVVGLTVRLFTLTHTDNGTYARNERGCMFLDPVTRKPVRNNDGTGKVARVWGVSFSTKDRWTPLTTHVSVGGLRTGVLARPWFLFASDHIAYKLGKHHQPDCTTPAGVPDYWQYEGILGRHFYC